tara:strand:+ start:86 stop:541 length:456 start_codon:yes stop_codon:yes gene_type:complete
MSEEKEISTEDKLDTAFAKERKELSEYIKTNIIDRMNSIDNIADIQVHILSQRQKLVDKSNSLRAGIRKRNKNLATTRKQKFRFYKLDYDIKISDYEISRHIDADVESSQNMIKMMENQITYYKETTDGLDKTIYMIKYLIEVKKYLSGGF